MNDGADEASRRVVDGVTTKVFCRLPKLLFNAQQLVVLGDAVRTAGRAGLDLARTRGHCEVGDKRVLRLAGAMGDDAGVAKTAA